MKVRTGSLYVFEKSGWDKLFSQPYMPEDGTVVKVVQPYNCPKNNIIDQCYIALPDGTFLGMVSVYSLTPKPKKMNPQEITQVF